MREITILGMGETAHERRIDMARHIVGEAWTLNDGAYGFYSHIRSHLSRVYEMHSYQYLMREFTPRGMPPGTDHFQMLQSLRVPVYCCGVLPLIELQVRVPWRAIFAHHRTPYFLGSPAIMLAHALYEHDTGFEIGRIRAWGLDHMDEAHRQQRTAWAFWASRALDRGIEMDGCALNFTREHDNDTGLQWMHDDLAAVAAEQAAPACGARDNPANGSEAAS